MFEHLSDFNLSVPYSLNRKNRWSLVENVEEHAQLLGVKRNDGALPMDGAGAMFVALAESEFTHNDVNPGERLNVFFYTFNFIYNLFYYNLCRYFKYLVPRIYSNASGKRENEQKLFPWETIVKICCCLYNRYKAFMHKNKRYVIITIL